MLILVQVDKYLFSKIGYRKVNTFIIACMTAIIVLNKSNLNNSKPFIGNVAHTSYTQELKHIT